MSKLVISKKYFPKTLWQRTTEVIIPMGIACTMSLGIFLVPAPPISLILPSLVWVLTVMLFISIFITVRIDNKFFFDDMTQKAFLIIENGRHEDKKDCFVITYNNSKIQISKKDYKVANSFSVGGLEIWPSLNKRQTELIIKEVREINLNKKNEAPIEMNINLKMGEFISDTKKSLE